MIKNINKFIVRNKSNIALIAVSSICLVIIILSSKFDNANVFYIANTFMIMIFLLCLHEIIHKLFSKTCYSILKEVLSVMLLFGFIYIVGQVFAGIKKEYITIEKFEVPDELARRGYTGQSIASRLYSEMIYINNKSGLKINDVVVNKNQNVSAEIIIPGSSTTLNSIIVSIKSSINKPIILVNGDVAYDGSKYNLVLTVTGKNKTVDKIENVNINELITEATEVLLSKTDPIVLASYYHNDGRYDDSIYVCKHIKEKYKNKGILYLIWASSCANLGRYEEALNIIKIAENTHYSDGTKYFIYNVWGYVLRKNNKYDEAIEKFKVSISMMPDDFYPNIMMSDLLVLNGRYAEAAKYLNKSLLIKKQKDYNAADVIIIENIIETLNRYDNKVLDGMRLSINELIMKSAK